MRISDWSSDVCSSDLLGVELGWIGNDEQRAVACHVADIGVFLNDDPADRRGDGIGLQGVAGFDAQQRLALANSLSELARHPDDLTGEARANDRKSVVEGKSVSVRVDIGGGGVLKKKKIK